MELRDAEETKREIEIMFTSSLGRTLTEAEHDILMDIVSYPAEKRIAFLEMMKELINKHERIK